MLCQGNKKCIKMLSHRIDICCCCLAVTLQLSSNDQKWEFADACCVQVLCGFFLSVAAVTLLQCSWAAMTRSRRPSMHVVYGS